MPIVSTPSAKFNGGTITTPLTITASDVTADPLTINLDFSEKFVFGTSSGNTNVIYFSDNLNSRVIEITDASIVLGGSSYIAPKVQIFDAAAFVTLAASKSFRVTDDASNDKFRVTLNASQVASIGFYGTTPTVQPSAIPSAAGGVVIDAEARTALNSLLAAVRALGLIAT